MRKIVFIAVFLLLGITVAALQAQTVQYAYDNAGNRIERSIELLKSASIKQTAKMVDDTALGYQLKIYPNPTKGQFSVEVVNLPEDSKGEIYLVDNSNGQIFSRKALVQGNIAFDLSAKPQGLYVLIIRIGEKSTTWKVIKE